MSGLLLRGGGQGGRAALGKWRDLPVSTDGLLGVFILGQSLAASIKNRWGDDDAVVEGSPTVNQYSLNLNGGVDYLGLPFVDPAAFTFVAVGRDLVAGTPNVVLLGSSGSSGYGASIYSASGTAYEINAYTEPSGGGSGTNRNKSLTVDTTENMKCLIADGDETGIAIADMSGTGGGTGAARATASITAGQQRREGRQMAIGGRAGTSYVGACEVSMAFVWARRLSADERAALYTQKILPMHQSWGFTTV